MKKLTALFPVLAALAVLASPVAGAAEQAYISVGQAKTKKTVIAFPALLGSADGKALQDTVVNDLQFMDLFRFVDKAAFVEPRSAGITPDRFKMSDWKSIGTEFLIKGNLMHEGSNLVLEVYLYDVVAAKSIMSKRYISAVSEVKTLGHTFANDIVRELTGLIGIFQTKIAMICEKTAGKKEVYITQFDGTGANQLTSHRSITVSPSWSPDGTRLAYSLYTPHRDGTKNLDLYEYSFSSNAVRMLSNRKTLNSGAAYAPNGAGIALTMNFLGNPEIFLLGSGSNTVTRLTRSLGFDVDPTWSPDGKELAFISTRSGPSMVFKMNADGSGAQRLTFAGKFNSAPSWSPRGNKIAFAGWIDGGFDIFIMNSDGSNIERLTKGQGSNEDPHFSPDGNFIVFSSSRTGAKNVYVMNIEGSYVRRLTYGMGQCTSPKWSNPPPKG